VEPRDRLRGVFAVAVPLHGGKWSSLSVPVLSCAQPVSRRGSRTGFDVGAGRGAAGNEFPLGTRPKPGCPLFVCPGHEGVSWADGQGPEIF